MKFLQISIVFIIFIVNLLAQDIEVPSNLLPTPKNKTVGDEIKPDSENSVGETENVVPPKSNPDNSEPELEEFRQCPIGFVLENSSCVPSYSKKCPAGYSWKNNRCELFQVVCPINFEYDGTKCIERAVCPPNYVFKNEKCELAEIECPQGFRWDGKKCIVANIECQEGTDLINNECISESISCPSSHSLVNGICVEPVPICPPGYELKSNGFCTKIISKKCPVGSKFINGKCQEIEISECPPGSEKIGNNCYQIVKKETRTTEKPSQPPKVDELPKEICPYDFTFYNGQCYKCPEGYSLCNGKCLKNVVQCGFFIPQPQPPNYYPQYNPSILSPPYHIPNPPSTIPDIKININFTNPPFQPPLPPSSNRKPYTIVNNIEPINNTIHNINNITHPVTLNNVNENNIYVYIDSQCADGSIRTTIVKNNETIIGCIDADKMSDKNETLTNDGTPHMSNGDENSQDESVPEKCCEIVTPRQCKKRFNDQWICTHRRYKYCGKFCIASRLYLKPPATTWKNSILTIQPSPNHQWITPCYGLDCPPVDCSGCMDGSFNCSPQCYTYPCSTSTCTFLDQEDFCKNANGEMCSK